MNRSTPDRRFREAGVRRRALAFLVDALVVGAAALVVSIQQRRTTRGRLALLVTIGGVGGLLYHVLLEGSTGRTLGKVALGVRVVRVNGDPCTYGAAAIRTAMRLVDWLPFGYLLGLATIGLTERHQRLGDLAAGTLVVRGRRTWVDVPSDHRCPE